MNHMAFENILEVDGKFFQGLPHLKLAMVFVFIFGMILGVGV